MLFVAYGLMTVGCSMVIGVPIVVAYQSIRNKFK